MDKYEILYPNTDYQTLYIKRKWTTIAFNSSDKDGDLEIEVDHDNDYFTMYLDQEGIKMLIDHLQKQLK